MSWNNVMRQSLRAALSAASLLGIAVLMVTVAGWGGCDPESSAGRLPRVLRPELDSVPAGQGQTGCPAINFQTVQQLTADNAPAFFGLQRVADGSFTRHTYLWDSASGAVTRGVSTLNQQQLVIQCAGLAARTRHVVPPNIKSDPLGSEARNPVVTDLVGDGSLAVIAYDYSSVPSGELLVQLSNLDLSPKGIEAHYAVGPQPRNVLAADFNGDGKKDIAVIYAGPLDGSAPGGVSLLLNNGNGSLRAAVNYPTGIGPMAGTAFDFDGDGRPDIAVGHYSPDDVTILLSKADGTLKIGNTYTLGTFDYVSALAAADLNSDHKGDLLVLAHSGVHLLYGKGDGSFTTGPTLAVPASNGALEAGDLNGDGSPDLIVNDGNSGIIYSLLATGNGTYGPPSGYSAAGFGTSFFLEDFDGDGSLDVVLAGGHPDALTNPYAFLRIGVLFGNGDGSFAGGTVFPTEGSPFDDRPTNLAIADFNGDGKPDVATSNPTGNSVSVALSRGNGAFQVPVSTSLGVTLPSSIATGDFNGDSKADIVVTDGVSSIKWLAGKGDGTFLQPITVASGGAKSSFVLAGDFDGDKKLDLAIANTGSNTLSILLGNGDGSFKNPVSIAVGPNPIGAAAGDFNGDGKVDLAVANSGTFSDTGSNPGSISVLLGKGDGSFQPAVNYAAYKYPVFVTTGDLNGDKKADLVVASRGPNSVDQLAVLAGTGTGAFQSAILINTAIGPTSIAVGDFSGNGKADLVVAHCCQYRSPITALQGNGDGSFQPETEINRGSFTALMPADFNGDGKLDIAYTNFSVGGNHTAGVLLNISAPGATQGSLTLTSAAGNPLKVPPLSPDSIATAKGAGLATTTVINSSVTPPTTLGGTTGVIKDSKGASLPLPFFYVSPTQVNFQIPAGVAVGTATVTVTAADGRVSTGTVDIAALAPAIFTLNSNSLAAAYVQRVRVDGTQSIEFLYAVDAAGNVTFPGIDMGPATDQVYMNIYGTGFRGRASLSGVTVTINGVAIPVANVAYAGPSTYPGEDQLAILLPRTVPSGAVQVQLKADGVAANGVTLNIK